MDGYETQLLYLLCRLAAADGEMAPVELDLICAQAERAGVPADAVRALRVALEAGDAAPEPDMAVLRARPAETRALARTLVAADGVFADAEFEALAALDAALATR